MCDGGNDCGDNSDEAHCPHNVSTTCSPWLFRCSNGVCITRQWLCDGDRDCIHGEDEDGCTTTRECPFCLLIATSLGLKKKIWVFCHKGFVLHARFVLGGRAIVVCPRGVRPRGVCPRGVCPMGFRPRRFGPRVLS